MTTNETITFEQIPLQDNHAVLTGLYDGFTWTNFGVIDRAYLKGDPDGFDSVLHGHNVAGNGQGKPAFFSSTTDFSLKSGYFAAAWDTGLHVKFTAYLNGVAVGSQAFVLGQTSELLTFNKHFAHIDEVKINTWGGTHGTGNGGGREFAVDNIKVVFDGAIPTTGAAAHDHGLSLDASHGLGLHEFPFARDFAIAHPLHDWIAM